MIISMNELLEICKNLTDGKISDETIMEDYHLRFGFSESLTYPVNDVKIDSSLKSIVLVFNEKNIRKRIDD